MAEIFACPTVRATNFPQALAQMNNRLQLLTRMLNSVKTGANIPSSRLAQGAKIDGVEGGADVTVSHQIADKRALVVKVNASYPYYQIDVDADYLKLDESTLLLSSVDLTIDISAGIGANKLDTGSEAADTWYSIWVIYNPTTNTVAGLFSTSVTSPTMPSGYTKKRRVGWVRNDFVNNFIPFINLGDWWHFLGVIQILNTVDPPVAWTDLDVSSAVPPTSEMFSMTSWLQCDSENPNSLQIERKGGGAFRWVGAKMGGATDNWNWHFLTVLCDADQVIRYIGNADTNIMKLYVSAYYDKV